MLGCHTRLSLLLFGMCLPLATTSHAASNQPQVFAPGIISSGAIDSAPTFSPDGREIYFDRGNKQTRALVTSHLTASGWSEPVVAPFSGHWMDLESAMAADGSYFMFSSNRPATESGKPINGFYYGKVQPGKGGALWRVDRVGGAWGQPHRLPEAANISTSIYEPSLAANGDLYFQSSDADGKQFHLYIARASGSGYAKAERVDLQGPPDTSDMDPAIAPDESYLLFSSDRDSKGGDHHIFIAFRTATGWSAPQPLGPDVNDGSVGDPRIDPVHHGLYFISPRLAPATGNLDADLKAAVSWNNGLSNIWWAPFNPEDWRKR